MNLQGEEIEWLATQFKPVLKDKLSFDGKKVIAFIVVVGAKQAAGIDDAREKLDSMPNTAQRAFLTALNISSDRLVAVGSGFSGFVKNNLRMIIDTMFNEEAQAVLLYGIDKGTGLLLSQINAKNACECYEFEPESNTYHFKRNLPQGAHVEINRHHCSICADIDKRIGKK